jgi:hypothetical protein
LFTAIFSNTVATVWTSISIAMSIPPDSFPLCLHPNTMCCCGFLSVLAPLLALESFSSSFLIPAHNLADLYTLFPAALPPGIAYGRSYSRFWASIRSPGHWAMLWTCDQRKRSKWTWNTYRKSSQ